MSHPSMTPHLLPGRVVVRKASVIVAEFAFPAAGQIAVCWVFAQVVVWSVRELFPADRRLRFACHWHSIPCRQRLERTIGRRGGATGRRGHNRIPRVVRIRGLLFRFFVGSFDPGEWSRGSYHAIGFPCMADQTSLPLFLNPWFDGLVGVVLTF